MGPCWGRRFVWRRWSRVCPQSGCSGCGEITTIPSFNQSQKANRCNKRCLRIYIVLLDIVAPSLMATLCQAVSPASSVLSSSQQLTEHHVTQYLHFKQIFFPKLKELRFWLWAGYDRWPQVLAWADVRLAESPGEYLTEVLHRVTAGQTGARCQQNLELQKK